MSDATEDEHPHLNSLRSRVASLSDKVFPVSGFALPSEMGSLFAGLHRYLATAPSTLEHMVPLSEKGRNWRQLFTKSLLGDVQEGLCAGHFHVERIESLERQLVLLGLEQAPRLLVPPSGCVAGGNTRQLNFEYQASYFAMRRTLEYLSVCVAAYFRADCHSIKDLGKVVAAKIPLETRTRVLEILARLPAFLPGLIPEDKGTKRSVRDKLAHWESVSAGTLNISRRGDAEHVAVEIVGGGENLFSWSTSAKLELTHANGTGLLMLGPVMRQQLSRVDEIVGQLGKALCPEAAVA